MDRLIGVIGLGYVGLPLAVSLGKKQKTIGFDINRKRVEELKKGHDSTLEVDKNELEEARYLEMTDKLEHLREATIFIVTVPTPIDVARQPDLRPLLSATKMVGGLLKPGDLVIYESTVYPGCTEEDCVPILEAESGLAFNREFFCGYSPERINPGDKLHRLETIRKVVSGSTPEAAREVQALYDRIIEAGTYLAPDLKTAEAAKVIENAQRDINIAFVNELAIIFEKLKIDTHEVLKAAATKWNFLPFQPGMVGGHCIGVDPYYLTYKAETVGHHPQVILSGRRINDGMGCYLANRIIKLMIQKGQKIQKSRILVLGITFKENCPDIRNTRVIDLLNELGEFGVELDVYDPIADSDEVREEYGVKLVDQVGTDYDALVLAVPHAPFADMRVEQRVKPDGVIFDVKGFLDRNIVTDRL